MNIFISGSKGLVGSHLVESLQKQANRTLFCPGIEELDITSKESLNGYFDTNKPDFVIHFAAFTDVSAAEKQRGDKFGLCWQINVDGTRNLAEICAKNNIHLIHISTDMVFSGKDADPGPYAENHPLEKTENNTSWYGWTKIQAEIVVRKLLEKYTIIRISNPTRTKYDIKLDYVRKILNLYDENKMHPFFDDQHLTLTFINNVTDVIEQLITKPLTDIFHISSNDLFTPFELATYLLQKTRDVKNVVQKASLEKYSQSNSNRYVQFAGLTTNYTQQKLGVHFPTWKKIIDIMIEEGLK